MFNEYDVIVVGAGHAGCEAAAAAANLGSKVLLITMNMQTIAQMSCNPAMGGIAKGQIVREIDAMGGYSGIVSDKTAIQFRLLNKSKGPAMWSPRTQNDRMLFHLEWRKMLEQTPNIDFWQDTVVGLIVKPNPSHNAQRTTHNCIGIKTSMGHEIYSKSVVLTNGTFLNGVIHIGEKKFGGGRMGEKAATGITEQLIELGFENGRMKTGTPPRVDGRSLDYSKMAIQYGDENPGRFSFLETPSPLQAKWKENTDKINSTNALSEGSSTPLFGRGVGGEAVCWITYTNQEVHDILRTGFEQSPMFTGRIQGRGPRYCPSIEDKIDRFADKERHQLFIEPEGWNTVEIYVNGFSTSLPEEVQMKALKKIEGFENVKMFRPGYAIEYDYFPPTQLRHTLETRLVSNLFFAGQINGTTGYEEAACQGLMAGINAHRKNHHLEPIILKRNEAYIGVLIDDLITKGTDEPYRMFTSRAEFRLLIRNDNADLRLTPFSYSIGLAKETRLQRVKEKERATDDIIRYCRENSVSPDEVNPLLLKNETAGITEKTKLHKIVLRPQITLNDLKTLTPTLHQFLSSFDEEFIEQAEIQMKYEGYLEKEKELVEKMSRLEDVLISENFDYSKLASISLEAREKLKRVKPRTIGQASRISGVSPSDVSILMVYMGR